MDGCSNCLGARYLGTLRYSTKTALAAFPLRLTLRHQWATRLMILIVSITTRSYSLIFGHCHDEDQINLTSSFDMYRTIQREALQGKCH